MPISHDDFRALPLEQQLALVWQEGTYLARRWEEEDGVLLYHLGSFFCEVYYDPDTNELLRTHPFTRAQDLEDYACYITLRDLPTEER